MKRCIACMIAVAMFIAMLPMGLVYGAEDFSVSVPAEEIGGMTDPDEAALQVTTNGKACKVEYACEELGIKPASVELKAGETEAVIPLEGILNGEGTLNVTVTAGTAKALEQEIPLRIFPKYEKQFMDEYSERCMGNHFAQGGQSDDGDAYMLKRAGITKIRDDMSWGMLESEEKGNWTYDWSDRYLKDLWDQGIETTPLIYGLNDLYTPNAPTTSEELDAYGVFLDKLLAQYGNIKAWEVWNEPNLGHFWKPEVNAFEYMKALKLTANKMRQEDPNTEILGGSINSTDTVYLKKMFEDRAFAYMDYLSYHPYLTPWGVDEKFRESITKMDDTILDYGGWKEGYITEIGWPTHDSPQGNTEETQALEIAKMYIVGDSMGTKANSVYVFKDCGDDDREAEHRFGLIHRDYTPKPSYYSLSQLLSKLNGAVYMGELNLNQDINAHVYMKDHQPVVAMWVTEGSDAVNFDFGKAVEVVDEIGNPVASVSSNTYRIDNHIFYVKGVDKSWFNWGIAQRTAPKVSAILERFDDALPADVVKNLQSIEAYIVSLADKEALPQQAEIAEQIDLLYTQGDILIDALQNGSTALSDMQVSTFLYMVQRVGNDLSNLFAAVTESGGAVTSNTRVTALYNKMAETSQDNLDGTQVYAQAVYRYAKRLSEKAAGIYGSAFDNPSKDGLTLANDTMANKLLDWAEQLAGFEPVTHTAFSIEVPREDTTLFEGEVKDLTVGVRSMTDSATSGKIRLYDPDGKLIQESDELAIAPNKVTKMTLPVLFEYDFGGQKADFKFELVNGEQVLDYALVTFRSEEKVTVSLEPQPGTLDEVEQVTVNLEGIYHKPLSGTVEIQAPDGWELETTKADYTLDVNGKTSVSFNVTKTSPRAYNFYTFSVRVKDKEIGEVINTNVPQSFLAIVKNTGTIDPVGYKGEMEDWADAYPIFVNPPKYANSIAEWRQADIAGMTFLKWDEEYFYLLSNVYDDRYVQQSTGYGIWSNDNIQFALDTRNDKSSNGYQPDDYEIGMAYTPQGREMYAWFTAEGVEGGQWDPDMTNVIRDEELNCTRYIVKLPKSHCTPLNLQENTHFGFNIGLNDADVSQREAMPQFTSGLCDGKNPSLYYTFTLVGEQPAAPVSDIDTYRLPIELSIDWENSFKDFSDIPLANTTEVYSMFNDVVDHWAKKDIENMAKREIVDGVGNGKFEPERSVTRAEFIALLAKSGIPATGYQGGLTDVKADDWYAGYIQTGIDSGVIPAEMYTDNRFMPDQPITREEMAAMVVNMYAYKTGTALPAGESLFVDEDTFSPWAVSYINAAGHAGLVNGVGDDRFDAQANATRAESVVIVKRLLAKL